MRGYMCLDDVRALERRTTIRRSGSVRFEGRPDSAAGVTIGSTGGVAYWTNREAASLCTMALESQGSSLQACAPLPRHRRQDKNIFTYSHVEDALDGPHLVVGPRRSEDDLMYSCAASCEEVKLHRRFIKGATKDMPLSCMQISKVTLAQQASFLYNQMRNSAESFCHSRFAF